MTASVGTGDEVLAGPRSAGRWELLRALGAVSADVPRPGAPLTGALGLPPWTGAEHTQTFVFDLPPHASIHLGSEGKLGGEGADRVAGMWRALGLDPPAGADHLAFLLALYAHVGEAAEVCTTARARGRLEHTRQVLLWEHLWSWVPGYLDAAAQSAGPEGAPGAVSASSRTNSASVNGRTGSADVNGCAGSASANGRTGSADASSCTASGPGTRRAAGAWAKLTMDVLRREADATPAPAALPAALRQAPPALDVTVSSGELLDAVTAPVRVGFVLTFGDVERAGREIGVGVRRGERRFALRSMLEQDPHATVAWLARHARRWASLAARRPSVGAGTDRWWAERAAATADALDAVATG